MVKTMKSKISEKYFGVRYGTLWTWYRKGVPSAKVDSAYKVLTREAKGNGCPIQGTPHDIKTGLRDGSYFLECLKAAFPGVWT